MERKQFTFYKSFYTAIRRIRRKADRCDAYDALLDYAFSGVMPDLENLTPTVAVAFEMVKPHLDTGRRKAENGMLYGRGMESDSKETEEQQQTDSREIAEENQNDSKNKIKNKSKIKSKIKSESEYECIYSEIVAYLNSKTGKAYRPSSRRTRAAIHARLEEGFVLEDFKAVIDRKCADWLKDPKMEEYLRPETLFGPKFESYLNAGGNHGTIAGLSDENRVGHYL